MNLPKRFKVTPITVLNIIGLLVAGYLLVKLGETVNTNYQLNRQAQQLQSQTQLLQDQKTELSYDIQYYQTNSYREKQARSQLGLQLPGETEVVLPDTPSATPSPADTETKATKPQSNFQKWVNFLGGKS